MKSLHCLLFVTGKWNDYEQCVTFLVTINEYSRLNVISAALKSVYDIINKNTVHQM